MDKWKMCIYKIISNSRAWVKMVEKKQIEHLPCNWSCVSSMVIRRLPVMLRCIWITTQLGLCIFRNGCFEDRLNISIASGFWKSGKEMKLGKTERKIGGNKIIGCTHPPRVCSSFQMLCPLVCRDTVWHIDSSP